MTVNKPNVSKIAGSDKMVIIGLSTALTTEKIKPASKKTGILASKTELSMPVPNNLTAIQIPNEFKSHLTTSASNCRFILCISIAQSYSPVDNAKLRLSHPVSVIRTSSSIRMPIDSSGIYIPGSTVNTMPGINCRGAPKLSCTSTPSP